MALEVYSAGFPRTGSASLKVALEMLGFAPCYHMAECLVRPAHWPMWIAAAEHKPVDWDALFDGFQSCADAPACMFWREIAAHYPQAKIIVALRDPERWYASTQQTVLSPMLADKFRAAPPAFQEMLHKIRFHPEDAENHDKDAMIARFLAHNEAVRRAIPRERLLEFDPKGGWEQLCAFLRVPVPKEPFPHVNTTDEFQTMIRMMAGAPGDKSFAEGAARAADKLRGH
jgi:hypothetical protein